MGDNLGKPMWDAEASTDARHGVNAVSDEQWDRSKTYMIKFDGKNDNYGTPPEGSLTAQRAMKARAHINDEVATLISVIRGIGKPNADGYICVKFGRLFDYYECISNKVVGILLRARRWGLVEFKGEMLYQGQDNETVIIVLADESVIPTSHTFDFVEEEKIPKPETLKEKLARINDKSQTETKASSMTLQVT